jgi:hypothetical protein
LNLGGLLEIILSRLLYKGWLLLTTLIILEDHGGVITLNLYTIARLEIPIPFHAGILTFSHDVDHVRIAVLEI